MLKQGTPARATIGHNTDGLWAYFRGQYVPLADARVSVLTHAFNYGTAVFEGIRAYWNAEAGQLYGLEFIAHYQRLLNSARFLMMSVPHTAEELAAITVEVLRRGNLREDVYLRPLVYKSSESIGVRLHNLDSDVVIFGIPFGRYIDTDGGIRAQISTWRRTDDNAIPARSKLAGGYVNGALAKTEAQLNGFDEAIVLTHDGHVSEGSAENLFMVQQGRLITPSVTDNILEGITRRRLMQVATELGIPVQERTIDRTELYQADEVFLCGTGAQVAAVVEIDRRQIGDGNTGPITRRLSQIYFDAVRGRIDAYRDWLTPIH